MWWIFIGRDQLVPQSKNLNWDHTGPDPRTRTSGPGTFTNPSYDYDYNYSYNNDYNIHDYNHDQYQDQDHGQDQDRDHEMTTTRSSNTISSSSFDTEDNIITIIDDDYDKNGGKDNINYMSIWRRNRIDYINNHRSSLPSKLTFNFLRYTVDIEMSDTPTFINKTSTKITYN